MLQDWSTVIVVLAIPQSPSRVALYKLSCYNLHKYCTGLTYRVSLNGPHTVMLLAPLSPPPPSPPPPHTHTIQTNGAFTFRIRGDAYRDQVRYRYDPFCVKSSIVIVAEVEESGRGTNQTATLTIPLVANPVSLKFTDENPKLFKPGLNHTMKVRWCEINCYASRT